MAGSLTLLGVGAEAAAGGDPSFANVELLAINESGADGTTSFDDQSTNNIALTPAGNAVWDNVSPPTGLSSTLLVDGTGDWVSVADTAAMELGSQPFTIEFFVKLNATGTARQVLTKSTFASDFSWRFRLTSGDVMRFLASSDGSNWDLAADINVTTALSSGTWYYIAVSRDGSNNGTSAWGTSGSTTAGGTWSPSTTAIINQTGPLTIGGATDDGAGDSFEGWIASVRITIGTTRDISTVPSLPFASS